MSVILSQLRSDAERISDNARWVEINYERLFQYPERLDLGKTRLIRHTPEHHLLNRGDMTIAFFILLDSINFGSGYFPYIISDPTSSGYLLTAKRLKLHIEQHGLLTIDSLIGMTPDKCAGIFFPDTTNKHAQELMHLYADAFIALGIWLRDYYDGDYLGVFKGNNDMDGVIRSLTLMPFFDDSAMHSSTQIHFLKRAQILLNDVLIADSTNQLLRNIDSAELTIFADNIIPFVLEHDGVLIYDDWLKSRIERRELIANGSTEEIEMRACSIHAVEVLSRLIAEELMMVHPREIDYVLWNRGQELKRLPGAVRHRTRSVFY
jgi:hypothetical protein